MNLYQPAIPKVRSECVSYSSDTGMFYGHGSPEGVVTAAPGASYYDLDTGIVWWKGNSFGNIDWTI